MKKTKTKSGINWEKLENKLICMLAAATLSMRNIVPAFAGPDTTDAVNASGGYDGSATSAWNNIMKVIWEWIPRLGGVIVAIGLIEFGIAFKSEDADGKTRGLRTAIAGVIVIAAVSVCKQLTTA